MDRKVQLGRVAVPEQVRQRVPGVDDLRLPVGEPDAQQQSGDELLRAVNVGRKRTPWRRLKMGPSGGSFVGGGRGCAA